MATQSVRRMLDRMDAGTLGPALTRPVAAALRRDALAALRSERAADAVLVRSLAHLEAVNAGTAERPDAGRIRRDGRTAPGASRPEPLLPTSSPAAVTQRQFGETTQLLETSQKAVPTILGYSRAQLRPPSAAPALRPHQHPGAEFAEADDIHRQFAVMVETAGARPTALAQHTVAEEGPTAGTIASSARRAVVAPAAVLGRDALERLLRPPAVVELERDRVPASPAPPTLTPTMSSPVATPTLVSRTAPLAEGRRRPNSLANLAAMYSSNEVLKAAPPADHVARPGVDLLDYRGMVEITATDESALPPAEDWCRPDSGSRTSPSPAAELAGAAAVLEAVLVHEARRYGVSVEES